MHVNAEPGTPAAVLGFPENGPYDVEPARLGQTATVITQDAYGRGPVERTITTLRGLVRPGNSGGPAVDRVRARGHHDLRRGHEPQAHRVRSPGLGRARRAAAGARTGGHGPLRAVVAAVVATTSRVRGALLIVLCCAGRRARRPGRGPGPAAVEEPPVEENPCIGPDAARLRCPDLVMRRPYGLYTRPPHQGRAHRPAGGKRDRQRRGGPGGAVRHAHRPTLHARAPAHLHPRRRPHWGGHERPAPVQVRPPEPLLVEVLQRRPLRAVARGRGGQAHCARSGPARRSPTACATSPARGRSCGARRGPRTTRPAAPTPKPST